MLALVIGPVAAHALFAGLACGVESEDVDVAQTHEIDSQNLDAVIWT